MLPKRHGGDDNLPAVHPDRLRSPRMTALDFLGFEPMPPGSPVAGRSWSSRGKFEPAGAWLRLHRLLRAGGVSLEPFLVLTCVTEGALRDALRPEEAVGPIPRSLGGPCRQSPCRLQVPRRPNEPADRHRTAEADDRRRRHPPRRRRTRRRRAAGRGRRPLGPVRDAGRRGRCRARGVVLDRQGRNRGPGRRNRGSGKSVTALSILQLLPYPNGAAPDSARSGFQGTEYGRAPGKRRCRRSAATGSR